MTEYTASTTNASDKITATATDEDATVVILSDDATIADDGTATWGEGENVVTIAVAKGMWTKAYKVTVSAPVPDATLSALTVGALTLSPTFDSDTTEYTATTSNNTNKITATATDEEATVEIESDDASIAADGTATWETGENVVTITVTNGGQSKVYTVTVTKSAPVDPET
ncbi:MAG: cadherin-like beta sandwich domain-containing protein [Oscillospiraceae bacterium]|nr:cadherin-like beta sandwich domain-containing protein [Oscillospiraceae bacterium]